MAKAKRVAGKKRDPKEAQRKELSDSLAGIPLLGEIITWGLEDKVHSHQAVLNGLTHAQLPTTVAKELLPKHAFTRAQRKLAEDRVIDTVAKDGDLISFQFTKRLMQSKEWVYSKECNVILNVVTGQIECDDKKLEAYAQRVLDKCIEDRTTADITKIIQKLFDGEADLFPIRDQGGCYFVPSKFQDFVTKIETFVLHLGGRINRFPVPAGSKTGDKSVADTVFSKIESALDELHKATEEFTIGTQSVTLANQAKYIRDCKIKVQAYASLLQDRAEEALDQVEAVDEHLKNKIAKLSQEKIDNPQEHAKASYVIFGHAVTAVLRWMGSKGWSTKQAKQVLEEFDIKVSDSTISCQVSGWKARGVVPTLTDEQIEELEEKAGLEAVA